MKIITSVNKSSALLIVFLLFQGMFLLSAENPPGDINLTETKKTLKIIAGPTGYAINISINSNAVVGSSESGIDSWTFNGVVDENAIRIHFCDHVNPYDAPSDSRLIKDVEVNISDVGAVRLKVFEDKHGVYLAELIRKGKGLILDVKNGHTENDPSMQMIINLKRLKDLDPLLKNVTIIRNK